jgi:hypothetical protein
VFAIRWSALPSVRAVNIDWQPYNSTVWLRVVSAAKNTGVYQWAVPRMPGTQARVRISNANNAAQFDVSNAVFRVVYTYTWQFSAQLVCANGAKPNHSVSYTQFQYTLWPPDPVTWKTAAAAQTLAVHSSDSQNNGYLQLQTTDSYHDVLLPLPTQAHAALVAHTFFNPPTPMIRWASTILPEAAYTVRYYAPTRWCPGSAKLQLLGPAANQVLKVATGYSITWVGATDAAKTVKIELSKDNGRTWYTIIDKLANRNSYDWFVSYDPTKLARLRVSNAATPSINTISPTFTITP